MVARCTVLFVLSMVGSSRGAYAQTNGALPGELEVLRQYVELSDEQAFALSKAVLPTIVDARDELSRGGGPAPTSFGRVEIWPELYEKLQPTIRKHVADDAVFEAFRQDLRLRQKFAREFAVDSAIVMLDRAVGLTNEQWETLPDKLTRFFNQGRLRRHQKWRVRTTEDLSGLLEKLDLTAEQRESWNANKALMASRPKNVAASLRKGDDDQRREVLRRELTPLTVASIRRISGRVQLDEKTKRKLSLAAKGAVSRAIHIRIAAEKEYIDLVEQGEQPDYASEVALYALQPHWGLLHHGGWTRFVRAALSEEQWDRLEAASERQEQLRLRHTGAGHVTSICYDVTLTGKQQLALRRLFMGLIPGRVARRDKKNAYQGYLKAYEVPRAKYVELLGEQSTIKVIEALDAFRFYFPNAPPWPREEEF